MGRGSWAVALLALCGFISNAFAQVNYVRDIVQPDGMAYVLPAPQAPYETSSPDYSTSATPTPNFFTTAQYYSFDSSTGIVALGIDIPPSIKLGVNSVTSFAGQNTSAPFFFSIGFPQKNFFTYNFSAGIVLVTPRLTINVLSSMAARSHDGDLLSLIADNQHFTVNWNTGELIAQPLTGVNMSEAFYQSYGQDGLLYVLDYGNNRMASFDPDNAFASVSSFTLQSGVTTANSQFGVGINGSFYLADGLGGGSYYDSTGTFQSTFELPEDAVADSYTGASYISTDSSGGVYVYDSTTGIHQYKDASVVPEPATYSLMGLGLVGLIAARRSLKA